jgi:hypothetical protein
MMLRRVTLVFTDDSKVHIAFIIRLTKISEPGVNINVVPSLLILFTMIMETICSTETFLQDPQSITFQKTALFKFVQTYPHRYGRRSYGHIRR